MRMSSFFAPACGGRPGPPGDVPEGRLPGVFRGAFRTPFRGLAELDQGPQELVLEGMAAGLPDSTAVEQDRERVSLSRIAGYEAGKGGNPVDGAGFGQDSPLDVRLPQAVPERAFRLPGDRQRGLPFGAVGMAVHGLEEPHEVRGPDAVVG